ncbi:MAG: S-methyl-5-thioribose-1-phosphate isomerase [Rickettsiales bacterium]|nr:S-methyl-5-thioribose-1-phosphate isomerase [Rickettsiales bacterium]
MRINERKYRTIWYDEKEDGVFIIDQTKLPFEVSIVRLNTLDDVLNSINNMQVRGAPLLGATAAFGLYLAYKRDMKIESLNLAAKKIKNTRPTAINLFWAIDRVMKSVNFKQPKKNLKKSLLNEAIEICDEDIKSCKKIGKYGYEIIKNKNRNKKINILTHCNAGWLATIDWGTATAPIYYARDKKIDLHIWVDETRPRNQGALLTSFELNNEKISNTVIADNAGGLLMQRGEVDLCITGADRVLKNGYVINKIGTYLKALAAKQHNIPFYVAIPSSTIDWDSNNYKDIIIEERNVDELNKISGLDDNGNVKKIHIYSENSRAYNPAFDITPNNLITGLITEKGIIEAEIKSLEKIKYE